MQDLAAVTEILYSAVLSDVLDDHGVLDRAFPAGIRPLDSRVKMFGPARTGLYMNVYHLAEGENPYGVEIALIDDLNPGDVVVLGCGEHTTRIAPWGELLSTAASMRGAVGCVTDGLVRDTIAITRMGFPVFHGGIGPLDSRRRGKMVERDVPIECGGVYLEPGDLVFGDADGVVAIPKAIAQSVIAAALAKITGENKTRAELLNGARLADVYARYGVL